MAIAERKKKIEELDAGYKKLMEKRAADPTRKQSVVKIGEDEAEVDTLISDCIQALNDAGFSTLYSCSGHEQDFFTKVGYYAIDVYREWTNAITKSSTQKHIVEKTMCGECYNKLSLYLTNELTNKEEN